ncbi:MAG: GntR family transcriptional regulator [Gammaproteobacteria bacterium]|jgi:GntR family transcriptional regulator
MSQHAMLNPNNGAPRFRQIFDILRNEITTGNLPEHTALPSERVVAEQHGVSRMTARRALEALDAEGLSYSEDRRGRFVSPQRLTYDISQMVSFAADAQANGVELEIEVIEAGPAVADSKMACDLSVSVGEPLHAYTRLFKIRGHAIFIETEYVIAAQFPDLLRHDLRQSTTQLLDQHYDTCAHTGDIVIRMRGVRADEAQLLGLAQNHAGIELEQVIRDTGGVPFCIGRQIWRGELAEFSARAIVNAQG